MGTVESKQSEKFIKLKETDRNKLLKYNKKNKKVTKDLIECIDLKNNDYNIHFLDNPDNNKEILVDLSYIKKGSYTFVKRFVFKK